MSCQGHMTFMHFRPYLYSEGTARKVYTSAKVVAYQCACLEKQTSPKEIEANQNKTFLQTDFCMNQKLPLGFQKIL